MLTVKVCHTLTIAAFLGAHALCAQTAATATKNTRYLALGDSLAFGDGAGVPTDGSKLRSYPTLVSAAIHRTLANAACPGESSGSFITVGAPDFGCNQWKADNKPLLLPYTGSQLDFAVTYLKSNPKVDLVTIDIGGNDLAVLQVGCHFDVTCELLGLTSTFNGVWVNLTTIYSALRGTGYSGPIVALTYYSFNYTDPLQTAAFAGLNSVIAAVSLQPQFHVKIADGFGAFAAASASSGGDPCQAGLLLPSPTGSGCDTHPSATGQKVLAGAVLKALTGVHL